jgi:hypothetical protein
MHIHDDAEVYEFAASEIAAGKPERGILAALKKDFTFLVGTKIPESDISSDQFSGIRNSLADAVRLSDVADALAILEFRLVDAVKTGLLDGVIDNNDEWWISKKRG